MDHALILSNLLIVRHLIAMSFSNGCNDQSKTRKNNQQFNKKFIMQPFSRYERQLQELQDEQCQYQYDTSDKEPVDQSLIGIQFCMVSLGGLGKIALLIIHPML